MKLDILAIVAHPDDAELCCGGTLLRQKAQGYKVGIVDLTEGELGSRGNVHTRREEAKNASDILGIDARENLQLPDGFFANDIESQLKVIRVIRQYRPFIIITNAYKDRHPDHARAGELVKTAAFLSGLPKIHTYDLQGNAQHAWRPAQVFQMIQSEYVEPDFVVDISPYWEKKKQAMFAYKTQFYNPDALETETVQTFISSPSFLAFVEARARQFGQIVGVEFAEGFTKTKQLLVNNLFDITTKSNL
ncbi:MAG: bacillithiol biosynthesis deacetylase BshB1 [Flammeovirgaceae bacterium]|nr:bacillithiol biosynthesis deacetylase BshB1 [Flammeovirgaceae bacterium]MDW8287537.1 bacillithiol biosynthesis deacetylase BshB1 [Flammeovirgaceae bacterium]